MDNTVTTDTSEPLLFTDVVNAVVRRLAERSRRFSFDPATILLITELVMVLFECLDDENEVVNAVRSPTPMQIASARYQAWDIGFNRRNGYRRSDRIAVVDELLSAGLEVGSNGAIASLYNQCRAEMTGEGFKNCCD